MTKVVLAVLGCICASILFAAYPDEYPAYLKLLGFSKDEIRGLAGGGVVTHALTDRVPGEYGVIAAHVVSVPLYYFRDYYFSIESYKSLRAFQDVGKFKPVPDMQDLEPLRFNDMELKEFLACRGVQCSLQLSPEEISRIPSAPQAAPHIYREILLTRLLQYKKSGLAVATREQLTRFAELQAYFPNTTRYLMEFPAIQNKLTPDFYYWSRSFADKSGILSLHHVIAQPVGEDSIIVDSTIYSNRDWLSSIVVLHLIQYADRGAPSTLVVYEQRMLTQLTHMPFETFVKNFFRTSLRKNVISELKTSGKIMEDRYGSRSYTTFPYGLASRDQK